MISIKPKWCELIASGKKTIDVRKTKPKMPKIKPPFKCYIYMTKSNLTGDRKAYKGRMAGKVIGEFVCDFINEYTAEFVDDDCYEDIRQVFVDDEEENEVIITSNEDEDPNNCFLCNKSCLTFDEIKKYIGSNFHEKPFYGWHISDLVFYNEPKEIGEFRKAGALSYDDWLYGIYNGTSESNYEKYLLPFKMTRPPQSWCYVEEISNATF